MVNVLEVTIKNLYSYPSDECQSIKFGDISVIIGPNNAGKTNIFRIFQLMANQVNNMGIPYLEEKSILNDPSKEAEVSIKLKLSEKEYTTLAHLFLF
ncbi:MAG: AAA family ATPase, partial [Caldisphaera sp.]